jgi:plastocyanin
MMRRILLPCLALASLTIAAPLSAATLAGSVRFVDRGGKSAQARVDARHTVIYFEPRTAGKVTAGSAEMVTRGKEFVPTVLPVTRGTTVKFPNYDPILHNVFSVSGENRFDLGLYSKGQGKPYTFKSSGVARIFCNVHHAMVGYVLVLDTSHFTTAAASGDFVLSNLPEGPGKLTVWHPQIEPLTVDIRPGAPLPPLDVTVTKERVPAHLNKLGKEYSRDRRDRYDR